ncbi:hypothetical protein BEL04_00025 [Mucilaginibacter sp. PPCGB 2223]|uniref:hypothetical protein n=1 Tax=Mucilaginibacter sp. PPCGB 2223 TaxID=1886027 RepID=UPI0008271418|nr:hypothetical protein [Mucilaginibacter sp. PPCGB 2223]OCX52761.1 hypothetical protein BEL04_00025 [Mucilaginibacter sp. PPCGB 2223]
MTQFEKILVSKCLTRHDGRSLWKYGLSDGEFQQLRKLLLETKRLELLDPRDVTLYYSEWWKRCYNGGFPSKKDVFDSIQNGQYYDDEAFYRTAKRGATLLGIKWIKNQNTLYFKTLLLQGGIPIKHISNNKGAYKNILTKLLEFNPTNIDDFAFNPEITSLLPASSQSDEIYECCLAIVRAIIDEDQEYLALLDDEEELGEITRDLKIKRKNLPIRTSKPRWRNFWVFEPAKQRIRLYLGIPDMTGASFSALFINNPNTILDQEYKLYLNDNLLCKFLRRADSSYKILWVDDNELNWDGTDRLPDIYLISCSGEKTNCQHLITHLPNLTKATLWTKYSEEQWILERSAHTDALEGFVLCPLENGSENIANGECVVIAGTSFRWIKFEHTLTIGSTTFKTGCRKIDWHITDHRPAWIQRSNYTVIRRKPKVSVYDENGEIIPNVRLKWRLKNTAIWNDWDAGFSLGLLEIQIQVGSIIEYDAVFNLGNIDVVIESNALNSAEITLVGNTYNLTITDNPLVVARRISVNKFGLQLTRNDIIPPAIQASLKTNIQTSSLRFELKPPFKGIEIIDNQGNIIQENSYLQLNHLRGLRLISNLANLVVNIWNTTRTNMVISQPLTDRFISVRTFEDAIIQLFALSDAMDGTVEIIIEIIERRPQSITKLKEYKIKRYDQQIEWGFYLGSHLFIKTGPDLPDLYAIPLDCTNAQLQLRSLINKQGQYAFPNAELLTKFVVFSKNKDVQTQPAFLSLDPVNKATTLEDREKRIIALRDKLLRTASTDDDWNKLLSYYLVCEDNDIPYSTFDILRAISFSSLLAAKAFVFLTCCDPKQNFNEIAYVKMEQDLGFLFHWINKDHWIDAMEWMGCFNDGQLTKEVSQAILSHFDNCQPNNYFAKIAAFVTQNIVPDLPSGYHLNSRISELRASFGARVLSEFPQRYPKIADKYQHIIPVTDSNRPVEILLRSPLVVALSIAGKEDNLWSVESEFKRRNIKYIQQLDPEWYGQAVNYSLTKLSNLS